MVDTTITTTQWVLSVEALEMVKEGQNLVARRTFNELYTYITAARSCSIPFPASRHEATPYFSRNVSCKSFTFSKSLINKIVE